MGAVGPAVGTPDLDSTWFHTVVSLFAPRIKWKVDVYGVGYYDTSKLCIGLTHFASNI